MSGTSTPQGTRSPPPPDGTGQQGPGVNPAPLTIGKRFVKQYYQALMNSPDQLHRLYRSASILSDGEGSTPTDPLSFETLYDGTPQKLKDRFFANDMQVRFDFDHGAIDAQESVNEGILLVVTGHVVYYPTVSEDEDAVVDDPIRKGFVHTFFLNANYVGSKKSYYVQNDILRFLKNPLEVSHPITAETPALVSKPEKELASTAVPTEPVLVLEPEPKQQLPSLAVSETKVEEDPVSIRHGVAEEAPGGGVEETKEELVEPSPVVEDKKDYKSGRKENKESNADNGAKNSKGNQQNNKKEATRSKSPVAASSSAPKPAPGSWASLVAGAGGGAPGSPVKAPPAASAKAPPKPPAPEKSTASQTASDKTESGGGRKDTSASTGSSANASSNLKGMNNNMRPKRDPDCTLVIKNLADNTKESDVLGLFEPFASQTKSRVVGITVANHRNLAFVDYDSVEPVMKAVGQHQKEPMRLLGRILEVDQKTAEQRARRNQQRSGGNYRSGSPNNGGSNRYGGGRGGHRRRDGGRGDRGGGRGGGGRGGK